VDNLDDYVCVYSNSTSVVVKAKIYFYDLQVDFVLNQSSPMFNVNSSGELFITHCIFSFDPTGNLSGGTNPFLLLEGKMTFEDFYIYSIKDSDKTICFLQIYSGATLILNKFGFIGGEILVKNEDELNITVFDLTNTSTLSTVTNCIFENLLLNTSLFYLPSAKTFTWSSSSFHKITSSSGFGVFDISGNGIFNNCIFSECISV
jgi:hypothetical protein